MVMILLLTGCSGDLLTVDVDVTATTQVEGAGLLGSLLDVLKFSGFTDFDLTSAEELANAGVAEEDIEEVFLEELTFTVTEGDDLDFLTSVYFYVEAPEVESELLASRDGFSGRQIAFDIEPLDLHDYVVSESMTLDTEVSASAPSNDTTIDAYARFSVKATIGGAVRHARD